MSERYQAFLKERYQKVLETFQEATESPLPEPSLVGSLCSVGHVETAQLLLEQGCHDLCDSDRAFSRYLLASAVILQREFGQARLIAGEMIAEFRSGNRDKHAEMFLRLTLAKYHYYRGRLGLALSYCNQALELSLVVDHPLANVWAHELAAQIQSLRGASKAAERHFATAIGLCVRLERRRHGARIGLALTLSWVRARPGRNHLELLNRANEILPLSQRFAHASLLFELARQETLAGECDRAESRLEEAYEVIDGTEASRYFATYALRQAEVAVARGRLRRALHHLDYAFSLLDDRYDLLLLLEFSALRSRIYDGLSVRERWEHWEKKAHRLQKQTEASWPTLPEIVQQIEPDEGPWNVRQRDIINYLKHNPFIKVSQARSMFRVSDITACRDLSALTKAGLLSRVGKARATQYRLATLN